MSRTEYFSIRGVIEGFYGTPWSHADRLSMLAFMGEQGFNSYFYSPKDDPYLRERWYEPHPDDQVTHVAELIAQAKRKQMAFYYCLSPGLSMEYSSDSHLEKVMEKYQQMFRLGVRHFGLLFDDIPMKLLHGMDQESFPSLADAHAYVIGRVWEKMRSWPEQCWLVVCPTRYHGLGNEAYIVSLGRKLPAEIHLFWTGRFICSPSITEGDAQRFWEHTGHPPLYWDNYPVNDLAMANELHIGPLLHRDPQLYRYAAGYVANAMEYVESSKIPLITIADYLRQPEQYEPFRSWQEAIRQVVGDDDSAEFLDFADNVQGSFLNDQEAVQLTAALHQFRFELLHGDPMVAVAGLKDLFFKMERTAAYLQHELKNRRLAQEIGQWVNKYWHWSKVGQAAAALIEEGLRGRTPQALLGLLRLKQSLRRAERLPQKVCGNVMKIFTDIVLQEIKRRV
ncbi:protein O-GlcNAcase [Brevibacillus fulvus]|uniref:Hyaluronoglucosaminidase n=1 Tax=Brevibacillus fulvus TaxID=1125967 RepID=A0A939BUX3_9BACL|nr:protein O-GlcNAcase [Brevibacillus fulvus]MBM7590056.1 hyaluronoglucosaminidase [Brevibacillus fulvus]